MPPLEPLLFALPVAALVLALGWRPWRAGPPSGGPPTGPASGPWSSALVVPGVFLAGWIGTHPGHLPPFPPREGLHWTFYATLLAALLAAPRGGGVRPVLARAAGGVALALGFLWGFLPPRLGHRMGWTLALGGGLVAAQESLVALSRRRDPRELAWILLLAFVSAALVLAQSSAVGGLIAAAVTTGVGGLWVLGLVRPGLRPLEGAAAPLTFALGGLVLSGFHFASTPPAAALLIFLAPHAAWVGVPGEQEGRGWRSVLARSTLTLLLGGVALAWPEPDPYAGWR